MVWNFGVMRKTEDIVLWKNVNMILLSREKALRIDSNRI